MQKRKNPTTVVSLFLVSLACWPHLQTPISATKPEKIEGIMMSVQSENNKIESKKADAKPIFACNMLALDVEQRRRHVAVTGQLRAAIQEIRAVSDGYEFRFPAEQATILLASEFIARERLCCPFFHFELSVGAVESPLWLRLRGPEGVKDFIKAEFGVK